MSDSVADASDDGADAYAARLARELDAKPLDRARLDLIAAEAKVAATRHPTQAWMARQLRNATMDGTRRSAEGSRRQVRHSTPAGG